VENTSNVKWSEQTKDGAEKAMLVYFANTTQGFIRAKNAISAIVLSQDVHLPCFFPPRHLF